MTERTDRHTASDPEAAPQRGRQAASPVQIPWLGWRDIGWRVFHGIGDDNVGLISAGVAFYALLASVPGIAMMVSIYGMIFTVNDVREHIVPLTALLPVESRTLIVEQLERVAARSDEALSLAVLISSAISLFSATAGVRALMTALNVIYEEREKRALWVFYGTAFTLTICALLFLVVALGAIAVVPAALEVLGLRHWHDTLVIFMRWPVLAVVAGVLLAVLYRFGPSRSEPKWTWISVGGIVAVALWLLGSSLFSLYVSSFSSYSDTYGSLGAVVILLLWFYVTVYVILIGAEINAEMEHQTRVDTTTGPQRPMGERGAVMADTLGRARK